MRQPLVLVLAFAIAGCGASATNDKVMPPWVKTQAVSGGNGIALALTGTVRARVETPVSFRVPGQIIRREVDAGEQVRQGDVLFRLDPRDQEATLAAARAEQAAAQAALDLAHADTERHRQLFARGFIARQQLERVELAERESRTRLDAASARLSQAGNASGYAVLRADAAGIVTEVSGEPGQVVAPGQPVAMLARTGDREIEVFFPEAVKAPVSGLLKQPDGSTATLALREVAGAADPVSRTWRARYRLPAEARALPLGSVVNTRFALPQATADTLEVPLGALDERGQGAQVWHIVEGKAQPLPVQVMLLGPETARIRASLPAQTRLIVLGTHLLKPGMAVRELPQ